METRVEPRATAVIIIIDFCKVKLNRLLSYNLINKLPNYVHQRNTSECHEIITIIIIKVKFVHGLHFKIDCRLENGGQGRKLKTNSDQIPILVRPVQ